MRKASAITFSIFIMMIMLAVLLGYTAFYVDQIILRPVVLMQDSEVSLRCFFILSNLVKGEYLRMGETVPTNSLRSDLLSTYDIKTGSVSYFEEDGSIMSNFTNLISPDAEIVARDENVFWTTVNVENLPVSCYANIFGPTRIGTIGIIPRQGVNELMDNWEWIIE